MLRCTRQEKGQQILGANYDRLQDNGLYRRAKMAYSITYMAVVVKKTGRYRYKTHRVINTDGLNVKLALKKKELDNLRMANAGQGRSITPSIDSLISEKEKVNIKKGRPLVGINNPTNNDYSKKQNDTYSIKNINFALRAPVEETKDLIAVHNATEKNVRGLLGLGGLPMPSIAIMLYRRAKMAYSIT